MGAWIRAVAADRGKQIILTDVQKVKLAGLGDGLGMISVYVCVWWGHGSDLYILGWQKLMGKRGNVRVGTDTLGSEKS